jgi:NitT/TauT family transport system substrate-binding protein
MKIKRILNIVALILMVFAIGCQEPPKPTEKIRFGEGSPGISSSAFLIAKDQGYFADQGLEIEKKSFDSGKMSIETMLTEGGLDIVAAGQLPIVMNSFERSDYAIVGVVVSGVNVHVIGRQDKGINQPSDLKGKKIGVAKGTTGELFLHMLLTHNLIGVSDVEIVDMKTADLIHAFTEGEIDAFSSWEPNPANAQISLGGNSIIFVNKDIFHEDYSIVANREFIKNHPQTLVRFLIAIDKAVEYIQKNREPSIDIVAESIAIDRETVTSQKIRAT